MRERNFTSPREWFASNGKANVKSKVKTRGKPCTFDRRRRVALRICWHGTSAENAKAILHRGFRPGTYFARHLEDAVGYGGAYVFEVTFPRNFVEQFGWQFTNDKPVPASRIVSLRQYFGVTLYKDEPLRKQISMSNDA